MRIAWGQFTHSGNQIGYGTVSDRLKGGLRSAGVDVISREDPNWDLVVIVGLPSAWVFGTRSGRREDLVYHTMYEAEELPRKWIPLLNRTRAVWVPSQWCKDVFERNGVEVPIFVSGYGVNGVHFPPVDRSGREGPFRFCAWAHSLIDRKGALDAVYAYQASGLTPDQATLEVKIQGDAGYQEAFRDENDKVIPGTWAWSADLRPKEIGQWLGQQDALVYASKGEAFGLMPLEAASTGLPVICSYNTGLTEYVNDSWALLVPTDKMIKSVAYSTGHNYDVMMCQPSIERMAEHMVWCVENREKAYEMGRRGEALARRMTWHKAGMDAAEKLREFVQS